MVTGAVNSKRTPCSRPTTSFSIPCSKAAADPEYDNRLAKVLASAFHGWNADVRDMLRLKHSTPADHESAERLAFDELGSQMEAYDRALPLNAEEHGELAEAAQAFRISGNMAAEFGALKGRRPLDNS